MAQRLELQGLLVDILESDNVYFQPPPNVVMKYPCIIYTREKILPTWANDKAYLLDNRYQVTVVHADPDSDIPNKIAALPLCIHDRFYVADNLNHNVFTLFF